MKDEPERCSICRKIIRWVDYSSDDIGRHGTGHAHKDCIESKKIYHEIVGQHGKRST